MRIIEATLLTVGSALKLKTHADQGYQYDYAWCNANPGNSNCMYGYYYNSMPNAGCQWWEAECNEDPNYCDWECKNTWHEIIHDNLEIRWKDEGLDVDTVVGYAEEFLQDAYMGWKDLNDEEETVDENTNAQTCHNNSTPVDRYGDGCDMYVTYTNWCWSGTSEPDIGTQYDTEEWQAS